MSNNIVFIVTEGETDELFYKKILSVLKNKTDNNCFSVKKIDHICMGGFGNFESKLKNILKRKISAYKKEDKTINISVFLCYDKDVFVGKKNPPINWENVEKNLKKIKVNDIYHIVADKSIEDFILLDFDGILKYLKLKNINKNEYKGTEGLKKLHKKAGKGYIKGNKSEDLLNSLDFNIIENEICPQLNAMCCIMGVKCKKIK